MVKNRRINLLPQIIRDFFTEISKKNGELLTEVTTAVKLESEKLNDLKGVIEGMTGKKVKINPRADPSILGGIIVKIGSKMFDSSLKTKIEKLNLLAMKENN